MVDLVKIRKKSKESKESSDAGTVSGAGERALPAAQSTEPTPSSSAAALVESPGPAKAEPAEVPTPSATEPHEAAPVAVEPPPPPPSSGAGKKAVEPKPVAVVEPRAGKPAAVKAPEPETAEPAPVATSPAPVEAEGEIAPDDEDRLDRFKRLAGKRRRWTAAPRSDAQGGVEAEEGTDLELLRFRVAGEDYAVDIDKIVEIVPPRTTTRVPNADQAIVGIISLRGTIVTVIDLRRKLGHPDADYQKLKDARMIVVERAGETAGFLVDLVSRVVKLDPSQLENHPVVSSSEQSEYVSGVFQSPDGLVILLDIERILAG